MKNLNLNPLFHTIYPNLIKNLIQRNPHIDPDSFTIDFSRETPNTITMGTTELSIGSFIDSLFQELSHLDLDPKQYTITEEHSQTEELPIETSTLYTVTINSIY